MSHQSLSTLVAIYRRKHGPEIVAYLDYFQKLGSLDEAIRFACHGKDGQIHGHQHLVGKAKLEQARRALEKKAEEIKVCKFFDELLVLVEDRTKSIDRFGVLAVYDTSLRLGAYLKLWPEVVYLHAGTRKGCKALGVATSGGTVSMEKLPQPVRALEAYQAEDFLCIFKDEFQATSEKAVGRRKKGCS
jgi:hypothetical protein